MPRLPIRFMDKISGDITTDVVERGIPFIDGIVFRFDPASGSGPRAAPNRATIRALVDTGADWNYADPAIIAAAGCPLLREVTATSATTTTPSGLYQSHLIFPRTRMAGQDGSSRNELARCRPQLRFDFGLHVSRTRPPTHGLPKA